MIFGALRTVILHFGLARAKQARQSSITRP
jgi:hypothetical protein